MKNNLILLKQEAITFINNHIANIDIRAKQVLFVNCSMLYDKTFLDMISTDNKETIAFYTDILRYGYPVFISVLYDPEFENLIGIPAPAMDCERVKFCRSLLYAFKTVGWVNFLLENERLGNLKISHFLNHTRIKFSKKYHWNEFLEKEYIEYYSKIIVTAQSESYAILEQKRPAVLERMKSHVFIFLNDFIGYRTDYETEIYFYDHARLDLQQETEWDMFSDDCIFNGIPYRIFVDNVADFSGYAIKHINYCALLLTEHPHLLMENLMYNASESDNLLSLISESRSITQSEAEMLLRNISLHSGNAGLYASDFLPPPPFIKICSQLYLRSISGSLWHPFPFLLENLHQNYPKDWNQNTNLREALFKEQLYDMFSGFKCIKHNVQITDGKRVITDIDAAIIDQKSGEIALFQLKWQNLTDFSSKSLASKSKNYDTTATQWVDDVKVWLRSCSTKELASKLGLKEKFVDKQKVYLFVLGRRHGNYSKDKYIDDGCAWTQWYQLLSCRAYLNEDEFNISSLHTLVRQASPYNKKIIERKTKYKIGKYTILYGGN